MFRVATGLFLYLAKARLTSGLACTHGLAHRAARRLTHALGRVDGAGNIQSVASCQVVRQVAGSAPLQLGDSGLIHYPGKESRISLSGLFFFGSTRYYQQTTTKPRSSLHPQLPNLPKKLVGRFFVYLRWRL